MWFSPHLRISANCHKDIVDLDFSLLLCIFFQSSNRGQEVVSEDKAVARGVGVVCGLVWIGQVRERGKQLHCKENPIICLRPHAIAVL
jgi:hypothetical protein